MKKYTVGEKVINGQWGGQEIWRPRTAGEVLAQELDLMEKKYTCSKDCDLCQGSGVYYEPDGEGDVNGVPCPNSY